MLELNYYPTPALPIFYENGEGEGGVEQVTFMRRRRTTPKTLQKAHELRLNLTQAESKLWIYLRCLREDGIRFRRQHAIGPYIADFCDPRRKIIIEVDGSPHIDQKDYDQERSAFLGENGYKVIRFWNHDIMRNIERVMAVIREEVEKVKDQS